MARNFLYVARTEPPSLVRANTSASQRGFHVAREHQPLPAGARCRRARAAGRVYEAWDPDRAAEMPDPEHIEGYRGRSSGFS